MLQGFRRKRARSSGQFIRNYLVQLLQITQGNVSQAARMAKRNRTDFHKLLTKHELKPEQLKD